MATKGCHIDFMFLSPPPYPVAGPAMGTMEILKHAYIFKVRALPFEGLQCTLEGSIVNFGDKLQEIQHSSYFIIYIPNAQAV